MSNLDDDFTARIKRVRARLGSAVPMPERRRAAADDDHEQATPAAILLPQLALLLGALAMIAGRAVAMNSFMIEPSTELLGGSEGVVVLLLLVVIGVLFGRSAALCHGALVVGAALAFLLEGYYIPLAPDLMGSIYNPEYVGRVLLGSP